MPFWESLVVRLYFVILAMLAVYGLHRYLLLALYHRHYRRGARPSAPRFDPGRAPRVTVQLPLYNERYVARRVIEAASRMDYPRSRLRIQVLDDSTDDTREIASAAVDELVAAGFRAEYVRRAERTGFKAGALAAGLDATSDDLVAIFDADFVPPRDFLQRTVPHFEDPTVGMVQARWGYLNRDYSLLTRMQALLLDGHFMLEHTARHLSGRFFNFNGTAGVFRRAAIVDAGGWQGDTLTEDLDLSYRTQLRGWRFVFLPDVECPSELPVDIFGLKNQQYRWTKGSIQVARKLLPRVWRSDVSLKVKLEASFHLTANLSYLLLVALSLLMPFAAISRARLAVEGRFTVEAVVFGLTTLSILLFYAIAQRELGRDWKRRLRDLPFILPLGVGMCINNTGAVVEAMLGRRTPFVRTAKYRIESLRDRWKGKRYRSRRTPSFFVELALALYMVGGFVAVAALGEWEALPYVGLFVTGFVYVFGLSLVHSQR